MKGSWRQWGGAGTKTSMCCVHTQLWLYGITTTVLTAPDSTGQTFCIHLLNYTHTRHFSLHYKMWTSRTLRSCSLKEELYLMTSLHLYGLYLTFGSVVTNYWNSYCRCYIATASPAKFQAAVEKAGLTFELPQAVRELDKLATRYENLERSATWCKDWEDRLRQKIQSVSAVRKNRGTYYIWLCRCYYPDWTSNFMWVRSGDCGSLVLDLCTSLSECSKWCWCERSPVTPLMDFGLNCHKTCLCICSVMSYTTNQLTVCTNCVQSSCQNTNVTVYERINSSSFLRV